VRAALVDGPSFRRRRRLENPPAHLGRHEQIGRAHHKVQWLASARRELIRPGFFRERVAPAKPQVAFLLEFSRMAKDVEGMAESRAFPNDPVDARADHAADFPTASELSAKTGESGGSRVLRESRNDDETSLMGACGADELARRDCRAIDGGELMHKGFRRLHLAPFNNSPFDQKMPAEIDIIVG